MIDYATYEIGLLYRKHFRNALEEIKAYDGMDSYVEIKSWLTSKFVIRNIKPSMQRQLDKWLMEFAKDE